MIERWHAPKLWQGETAFIIGGGPSLAGVDLRPALTGRRVIACNDGYVEPLPQPDAEGNTHRIRDYAEVHLFGDFGWWLIHWKERITGNGRNHPGLMDFPNLIITNCPKPDIAAEPRVKVMVRHNRNVKGDSSILGWYTNTGAAAIHLAYLFGCAKVMLLGFDMHRNTAGHLNWHRALKQEPPAMRILDHIAGHRSLRDDLAGIGSRMLVMNATPGSALDAWPIIPMEEGLLVC